MTDLVRLGLVIDSQGFVRAKRDMDGFRKSASDTTKQTDGMGKTMSSTNTIAAAFGRTLGLISASLVTTGIVRYADAWTNVENRLKLVAETTAQLESVTNGVVEVALRSHTALEETASLYSTLARYAGDLVDSDEELLRITETLNKSFAVSGAGAAEQAGAIRQLSQAFASGALRGDEFNSINENAPRIMDAVAASLNMTKGELRELAAEGGITAEIVINAVRGMAGEIDADFAAMDRTMGQFWNNATTNITQFIGSSDTVKTAVQAFGGAIVLLSENLDVMADAAGVLAVVLAARLTPSIIANTAALVANTAAMTAGATAAGVLRGAMALVGGPAGVAVLGAAAVYKLVDAYIDHNKEARDARVASELAAMGIDLANEKAAAFATTLTTATQSLRGYVAAGGALSSISLQMIKDATSRMRANEEEAESTEDLTEARLEDANAMREQQRAAEALARARQSDADHIAALREQFYVIQMSNDNQRIYNELKKLSAEATAEDREQVVLATLAILEYERSIDGTTESVREFSNQQALADRSTERFRDTLGDMFQRIIADGEDAFSSILDGFKRMIAEMIATAAANRVMISLGIDGAGSLMSKIPGIDRMFQNTGLSSLFNGLGGKELAGPVQPGQSTLTQGFDKTALLDGFKQMGLTIAASWTGGKIGTAIGEGLFNKQAESNIGQTIGSTIGAIWGSWGALAGSALGSLVDTMTGGDGYKRQNAGFLIGNTPGAKPEYTFDVEDFASGLKVTGFARREDEQVARELIEQFRMLDSMVVSAGSALGGFVDQLKITGLNEEATSGSLGTFLGLGRDADLPAQMKAYVDQLISSFGGLDQSIIDLVKNASTADDAIRVLGDATRLMQIQQLTSGMNAVEQAREQFNAQTSLTSVYQAATDQLRQLSMGYTGTIEQTAQLADAMVYQQEATYNLALAYLQVQSSVDSLFGNLSENIRMSLMSEQELYEYQRAQIEALAASINMMTDPEIIMGTAERIESQLSQVWGRLDEEQRKAMGPEFLQFIDQTNAIAQDKLRQGLAAVEVTQEDINRTIQQGIESAATQMGLAAAVQMQAAQMQMQAASVWADAANNRREANA